MRRIRPQHVISIDHIIDDNEFDPAEQEAPTYEDKPNDTAGDDADVDDDDDDDCVSIIDCQMVNGDGTGDDSLGDPDYYFDEDTGQIIHFLPNANGTANDGTTEANRVRVGNDLYTIRLRTASAASDDADPHDDGTHATEDHDMTADKSALICHLCDRQFDRNYQLKRHVYVEHGETTAAPTPSSNGFQEHSGAQTSQHSNGVIVTIVKHPQPQSQRKSSSTIASIVGSLPPEITVTQTRRRPAPAATTTSSEQLTEADDNTDLRYNRADLHPVRISAMTQYDSEQIDYRQYAPANGGGRQHADRPRHQRPRLTEYICKVCSAAGTTRPASAFSSHRLGDVDVHLDVHNGTPFAHRCELCDEWLASEALLQNHVLAHCCPESQSWQLSCRGCERRFETRPKMREHACIGKRQLVCRPCQLVFVAWPLWHAHQEWAHGGRRAFKCKPCGTEFAFRAALQMHRRMECGAEGGGAVR